MRYPAIAAAFYNTPHAITAEKLQEVRAFLEGKFRPVEPISLTREQIDAMRGNWMQIHREGVASRAQIIRMENEEHYEQVTAGPRDGVQMVGRVAVVNVFGVLAQRMNLMSSFSGGTSTEQLGAIIDALVADRQVRSIVLNVDSPGGSVFGIQELADKLQAARESKNVVAVANSMAASAAYWLASQAREVVVTPGGQVGSIGVIAAHTDTSKADETLGYKTTLITAGKFKGELDPSQPLSEDARANVQDSVDKYYSMFVKAVAAGRGTTANKVDNNFGQGRMVLAKDAVERGMADRVATLEQTLTRLGATTDSTQAASARERAAQMAAAGIPTR